jgi:PhnB protein
MCRMTVQAIPDGYHTLTPYFTVANAALSLDFVVRAFDADVLFKMERPDGSVGHAVVQIGDSRLMFGQASEEWKAIPGMVYMYVENADETYRRAMAAGATSLREPRTEFYGDRSGGVQDSQGCQWWMATHVEDVSDEEMAQRAKDAGRA